MIKKINQLNLGFSDAQNYTQRANKQMLNSVFVKNDFLDKLLQPTVYYLIGEKGTGKTAYAAFLNNNDYVNCKSILKFISSTDYEKFHELKKKEHLDISGYVDIWKTILLLLLAKTITNNEKTLSIYNRNNHSKLMSAIDEYYNYAFSPEIISALKIVDSSELAAKIICKYVDIGAKSGKVLEFSEQRLQMNLYYICNKFMDLFAKMKLDKEVILFIDGIDIRPTQIPYEEYLDCIKGLANACWVLNTELFANVKDSKGQIKIVLLLRPDIFNSLGLQNATNKLVDNAVYLDWRTTYTDYPKSKLYVMANKLLSYDQSENTENIWEKYFTWELPSSSENRGKDTAFMEFLKISLSRPRDIQRILSLIKEIMIDDNKGNYSSFDYASYNSNRFQNEYSEYFLSSLKDQLSFYYSDEDYMHFRKFFDFFDAPQFTYSEYKDSYNKFVDYILGNAREIPKFVEDERVFLQLLYDSNVIAAIEKTGYFHFSYREKSPSNIAPQVPVGEDISYRLHYGLYKKTKMGRYN